MTKIQRIPIHLSKQLKLPAEAVEALGEIEEAYLVIDASQHKITLTAEDPMIAENEAILKEIAELNEGMSLEDYGTPVPVSFLNQRGRGVDKKDSQWTKEVSNERFLMPMSYTSILLVICFFPAFRLKIECNNPHYIWAIGKRWQIG